MNPVERVWARLLDVRSLQFASLSQTDIGWEGVGTGKVEVSVPTADILIFKESGSWQQTGGRELRFSNVFRWTKTEDRFRLEHLRFGAEKPVFLFEMSPDANEVWREIDPHPCSVNCYRTTLSLEPDKMLMSWAVNGPTRNELIHYIYR